MFNNCETIIIIQFMTTIWFCYVSLVQYDKGVDKIYVDTPIFRTGFL